VTHCSRLLHLFVRAPWQLYPSFVHTLLGIKTLSNPSLVPAVCTLSSRVNCPSQRSWFFSPRQVPLPSDKLRLLDQAPTCYIISLTVCARFSRSWSKPVAVCLCTLWQPTISLASSHFVSRSLVSATASELLPQDESPSSNLCSGQ
jgi:hypothetical protein